MFLLEHFGLALSLNAPEFGNWIGGVKRCSSVELVHVNEQQEWTSQIWLNDRLIWDNFTHKIVKKGVYESY